MLSGCSCSRQVTKVYKSVQQETDNEELFWGYTELEPSEDITSVTSEDSVEFLESLSENEKSHYVDRESGYDGDYIIESRDYMNNEENLQNQHRQDENEGELFSIP